MTTVILAPRRADGGVRDAIWDYLRPHWEKSGHAVHVGTHERNEGPFNRAKATNRAARVAGDWDVAVLIDADVWVEPWQLTQAIDAAETTGRLSFCHTPWWGLSKRARVQLLTGTLTLDPSTWSGVDYEKRTPLSNSCAMAVRRDLWDRIGGYDERFQGWGAEDWGWHVACTELAGGENRIDAPVHHLHHPITEEAYAASRGKETALLAANHRLGRRYLAARGDPAALAKLIREAKRLAER